MQIGKERIPDGGSEEDSKRVMRSTRITLTILSEVTGETMPNPWDIKKTVVANNIMNLPNVIKISPTVSELNPQSTTKTPASPTTLNPGGLHGDDSSKIADEEQYEVHTTQPPPSLGVEEVVSVKQSDKVDCIDLFDTFQYTKSYNVSQRQQVIARLVRPVQS